MQKMSPLLLPAGLYDLLPSLAAHERYISGFLLEQFEAFGYEQVSPPLMEFEDTLLAGRGAALASQTFRVMDPLSQSMMGFRPDITMQVGRLAGTRMADVPRPLRLSYGGSTLRVKGEGWEKARQWRQAGIELIGVENPRAEAEVIAVAARCVAQLGVNGLVLDINLPGLVGLLLAESDIPAGQHEDIRHAVECKDAGWVETAGLGGYAAHLSELVRAAGDVDDGLARLMVLDLPAAASAQLRHAQTVIQHLRELQLPVEMTIDPVENRGFEYYSLVSFSLFSRDAQTELGRGGRYTITGSRGEETAAGLTLYVNALMDAVSQRSRREKILVPWGREIAVFEALHSQGFITVQAVEGGGDVSEEVARRLGCTHILDGDTPKKFA